MVYDSDFYTTRRPYRSSPAYSSYTTSYEPSRQVKILPGLGKVHIVHSYDRIVPYVGHKRLTVVTSPPKVFSTRPSVLHREYDWIENKVRPRVGYSATNRYLNSDSAVIFDSETSLIRAQTNSLLRRIHDPVPRVSRLNWPLSSVSRYYNDIPARYTSDNYIQKILITSPYNAKTSYTTYYSEPIRKYIGTGHLASVSYAGGRAYDRRPYIYLYENPLQNDIQLLSYYINKFKQEKAYSPDSSSKAESKKIEIEEKPQITEVTDSEPQAE